MNLASMQKNFCLWWCRTFNDPRNFTADVTQAGFKDGCKADFVMVEGDDRTLLGHETAEELKLLVLFRQTVLTVDDRTVILERNTST